MYIPNQAVWPPAADMNAQTAYYLVDTENIGKAWNALRDIIKPGDQVILFYSNTTPNPGMSQFGGFYARGVTLGFIECNPGTNGMDFQLVSYLGYLIAKFPAGKYIIVSNDGGYDPVVLFWRAKHIDITKQKINTSTQALTVDNKAAKLAPSLSAVQMQYINALNSAGVALESDQRALSEILMKTMTLPKNRRRVDTYNQIMAYYGRETGLTIYQAIKNAVKNIAEHGPYPIKPVSKSAANPAPQAPKPVATPAPPAAPKKAQTLSKSDRIQADIQDLKLGLTEQETAQCTKAILQVLATKQDSPGKKLKTQLSSLFGKTKGETLAKELQPILLYFRKQS